MTGQMIVVSFCGLVGLVIGCLHLRDGNRRMAMAGLALALASAAVLVWIAGEGR